MAVLCHTPRSVLLFRSLSFGGQDTSEREGGPRSQGRAAAECHILLELQRRHHFGGSRPTAWLCLPGKSTRAGISPTHDGEEPL